MNKKILKQIVEHSDLFVPLIFTIKQISVIQRYLAEKKLSNSEKKALYSSITKKLSAIVALVKVNEPKQYYINGNSNILPERLLQAIKLLDEYSKKYPVSSKIFIAGSFLFSKEFNDIDIFIVRERGYKEVFEEDKHIIFLSEKKLSQPVFQSAALISVANFIAARKIIKKKSSLPNLMSLYHEAVIEKLNNEKKPEAIRNLIFNHYLTCQNKLLDGKELKELTNTAALENIDTMLNELCKKLFSKLYLYVELQDYIKTLIVSIKNIKLNTHLVRYKNIYEEIIYGHQRSAHKTS